MALHGIRLIRNYFNKDELRILITANFFSILYYNSEVWNIGTLNNALQRNLLSASALALKLCTPSYHQMMSFAEIHSRNKRGTPSQMSKYRLSLKLHQIYNKREPIQDWLDIFFNQAVGSRTRNFKIIKSNKRKIGMNLICNRLHAINDRIPLDWLNLSFLSYKLKCKELFL